MGIGERFTLWSAKQMTLRPRWTVAVTACVSLFLIAQLPKLSVRTDVYDYVIDQEDDSKFWIAFRKLFPKDQFAVIAFESADLFTKKNLSMLGELTRKLEDNLEAEVVSLANVNDMIGEDDSFIVEHFLHRIPEDPAALSALRRRALENPLYQKSLISADGNTTAIAIYPRDERMDSGKSQKLLETVRAILAPYEREGYRFHLAGTPVTNYSLSAYMQSDMAKFVPIAFFLVILMVWFVYRNIRILLLAALGIGVTLMATLGYAVLTGIHLNTASTGAVPVVMALALSDLMHVFSHLDRSVLRLHPRSKDALRHILEEIFFPCFITSVNTAIGFFSLVFNRVPAIRHFGALAASGMFCEFFVTFGLIVPLILAFRPERIYQATEVHENAPVPRMLRWFHGIVHGHPGAVFAVTTAAVVWGAWAARDLRVETNLLDYFRKDTPVWRDANFIRTHLAGVDAFNIAFETDERYGLKEPANLAVMDSIQSYVESQPGVDTGDSMVEYFKEMNKSFHNEDPAEYKLPKSRRLLEQYLLLYSDDDLADYCTPTFDRARIVFRLREANTGWTKPFFARLKSYLKGLPLPPGLHVRVTGGADLEVLTVDAMVQDQVKNVFSSVGAIWLVMVFVLRSFGMATLFLVPNLFPIIINFGVMGAFGIPLDTGTALIAATAFGIVVDDTVHFFTRFQEKRDRGMSLEAALKYVTLEKGEASLTSTIVLSIGFGVLVMSHFLPVFYFGLLNVVVLLTGMAGDLFFLKSILMLWVRWNERRTA